MGGGSETQVRVQANCSDKCPVTAFLPVVEGEDRPMAKASFHSIP